MTIQIISFGTLDRWKETGGIVISSVSTARSLDEFDVNIIDLTSENLWEASGRTPAFLKRDNDLHTLCKQVKDKEKTSVVIVLPQDIKIQYNYRPEAGAYLSCERIRDCLDVVQDKISRFVQGEWMIHLAYENTKTKLGEITYTASFFFCKSALHEVKTTSEKSAKATTIMISNQVCFSTLQIFNSPDSVKNFVNYLFGTPISAEVPTWAHEIEILNDHELKTRIQKCETEIECLREKIDEAQAQQAKNARFKSVLYLNGTELAEVVFDILEQIFDYDLSQFIDNKQEDFLIKKDRYTLIGEIKGVTSNVKSENVSQAERHRQQYCDELEEKGEQEEVFPILVINAQRDKRPEDRDAVNGKQIKLARDYGCLIVETKTLLKIYELYVAGKVTTADCEKLFTRPGGGLLTEKDFVI